MKQAVKLSLLISLGPTQYCWETQLCTTVTEHSNITVLLTRSSLFHVHKKYMTCYGTTHNSCDLAHFLTMNKKVLFSAVPLPVIYMEKFCYFVLPLPDNKQIQR